MMEKKFVEGICLEDFAALYDDFIDKTSTEEIESFFIRLAKYFYHKGFEAGEKKDSAKSVSKIAITR